MARNQSAKTGRVIASVSSKLEHNLLTYAAAAGAAGVGVLALAQPSEAKIVYTPTNQVITHTVDVDLNHDGINDFVLSTLCSDLNIRNTTVALSSAFLNAGGAVAGNQIWGKFPDASALAAGVSVGSKGPFGSLNYVMGHDRSGVYTGPWAVPGGSVKNKYLGLKFLINGQIHFGWARLNVKVRSAETTCVKAVLTGYAYETVAGKAIITGKTSGPTERSLHEVSSQSVQQPSSHVATLGVLAQGAPAITIWRREEESIN